MKLTKNMGTADRTIRTLLVVILGVFYYTGVTSGTLGIILVVLGVIFLLSSFVSFCPLYAPFGIRTCRAES